MQIYGLYYGIKLKWEAKLGDSSGSGNGTGTGSVETPIDDLVEYWKWVEDTYGIDISEAIAEHGKAGKELLELYGDELAEAIEKVGGADDVIRLITEYSDSAEDILKAISTYGDDVVELITEYGDEAVDLFKAGMSADEVKEVLGGSRVILKHQATSGVELISTPGKTTTILGLYGSDTGAIIDELGIPKTTDFSGNPGGFNLLNTPDELYDQLGPEGFWNEYNKPFLDAAIERGDEILMATPITDSNLYLQGTTELTGYGREYFYLLEQGYTYVDGKMIRK